MAIRSEIEPEAHKQCPNSDVWQQFLEGQSSDAAQTILESHLATCTDCVRQLDQLHQGALLASNASDIEYQQEFDAQRLKQKVLGSLSGLTSQREQPTVPAELGRYRIISLLGQGAFGCVYLAEDPILNRRVAIKVPTLSQFNSSSSLMSFLDEARQAASLNHAGIVPIHDIVTNPTETFIVMKWLEGETLKKKLSRARISSQAAVQWVIQICQAVQHAHENGVIHRDLKPSNILIDEQGQAYVLDFGLSFSLKSSDSSKQGRSGTPAYMSPEQVSGPPDLMSPRSDVWAIGITLAEMLTGHRPFHATNNEDLFLAIQFTEPFLADIADSKLRVIVEDCLRKSPSERIYSAAELATRLEHWLSTSAKVDTKWKANRIVVPAAALLLAASWHWWYQARPTAVVKDTAIQSDTALDAAEAQQERVEADTETVVTDKYYYANGEGKFVHTGDGNWYEITASDPPARFHFKEIGRTKRVVSLKDPLRGGITVDLIHNGPFVVYDPNGVPDTKYVGEFRKD